MRKLSSLHQFDHVWARSYTMALAASLVLGKSNVTYINAAPWSLYGQSSLLERIRKWKGTKGFVKALAFEFIVKSAFYHEKMALNRCNDVYLSEARRKETLDFFSIATSSDKHIVIPAGVNTEHFYPAKEIPDISEELRIISVCRLSEFKNIQCVLKAVALIHKTIPLKYTIVGEGCYEKELRKLTQMLKIEDVVSFVGRKEDVENWYRKNHLFVLPSLYEGFGSVYIEAMASGLPCIALSNKSGQYSVAADEIIIPDINGKLMSENDPKELADFLTDFFQNPAMYAKYSSSARQLAESKFTWKNTMSKLLGAFEK